jgi:hypothetical protein
VEEKEYGPGDVAASDKEKMAHAAYRNVLEGGYGIRAIDLLRVGNDRA